MSDIDADFKAASYEYVDIEARLREIRKETKELNKRKKLLEEFIMRFMETQKTKTVRVSGHGKISLRESTLKLPLNQQELTRMFLEFFGEDVDRAAELMKYINDHRGTRENKRVVHTFR